MHVHLNETCYVCNKVFCCTTCLTKHFKRKHQKNLKRGAGRSKISAAVCPLCEGTPFALQEILDNNILQHIENKHLPLNCKKCAKVYLTIEELKTFTKCKLTIFNSDKENMTQSNIISNVTQKTTISTQTSPLCNASFVDKTPISIIEQCWKSKLKDDYISDSVSSIKNLSTMSNGSMRRSIGVISTTTTCSKGKLVRSTSTPVHAELLMIKPKERTFDASSAQVSSICNSDFDSLPDKGSAMQPANISFSPKPRKIAARPKVTAVTPLRQVMSKSIQKAFAEHGVMHTVRGPVGDKQKLAHFFDDNASRGVNSPLDLRLSPALRRSKMIRNNAHYLKNTPMIKTDLSNAVTPAEEEVMLSSEKVSRESIIITRTEHVKSRKSINGSNPSLVSDDNMADNTTSVYTTCQSVEIIRSTKMSSYQLNKEAKKMMDIFHNKHDIMTPTCREQENTKLKKLINFETPKRSNIQNDITIDETLPTNKNLQVPDKFEKFYTPESTPMTEKQSSQRSLKNKIGARSKWTVRRQLSGHFSPLKRPPLRRTISYDVKPIRKSALNRTQSPKESAKKEHTETWSLGNLMQSVIALPSVLKTGAKNFLNYGQEAATEEKKAPVSILKRATSFAGQLTRSNSIKNNDMPTSLKRKRTNSIKGTSPYAKFMAASSPENASFSKKYRIQPRRPIH